MPSRSSPDDANVEDDLVGASQLLCAEAVAAATSMIPVLPPKDPDDWGVLRLLVVNKNDQRKFSDTRDTSLAGLVECVETDSKGQCAIPPANGKQRIEIRTAPVEDYRARVIVSSFAGAGLGVPTPAVDVGAGASTHNSNTWNVSLTNQKRIRCKTLRGERDPEPILETTLATNWHSIVKRRVVRKAVKQNLRRVPDSWPRAREFAGFVDCAVVAEIRRGRVAARKILDNGLGVNVGAAGFVHAGGGKGVVLSEECNGGGVFAVTLYIFRAVLSKKGFWYLSEAGLRKSLPADLDMTESEAVRTPVPNQDPGFGLGLRSR